MDHADSLGVTPRAKTRRCGSRPERHPPLGFPPTTRPARAPALGEPPRARRRRRIRTTSTRSAELPRPNSTARPSRPSWARARRSSCTPDGVSRRSRQRYVDVGRFPTSGPDSSTASGQDRGGATQPWCRCRHPLRVRRRRRATERGRTRRDGRGDGKMGFASSPSRAAARRTDPPTGAVLYKITVRGIDLRSSEPRYDNAARRRDDRMPLDPDRVQTVTFDSYSTLVDVEAAEAALAERVPDRSRCRGSGGRGRWRTPSSRTRSTPTSRSTR